MPPHNHISLRRFYQPFFFLPYYLNIYRLRPKSWICLFPLIALPPSRTLISYWWSLYHLIVYWLVCITPRYYLLLSLYYNILLKQQEYFSNIDNVLLKQFNDFYQEYVDTQFTHNIYVILSLI